MSYTKKFVLRGVPYEVVAHPPTELGGFALRLLALASGPLATLITAQKKITTGFSVGDFDLSQISPTEVQKALITVVEHIGEKEIRELFSYTTRDGKSMSNDLMYDEAYRGNWVEWYSAIFHILKSNGFFDFLSSSTTTAPAP
jgi:hypothetical protein